MTRHDTSVLAIRLAALYAWLQALEYVASGVFIFFMAQPKVFREPSHFAVLVSVLPCVAMVAAGLLLWVRAPALASHFLAAQPDEVRSARVSAASLAFAVVGLALFLYALPRVISECVTVLRSERFQHGDSAREFLQRLPALAGSTVQLICGFALFVRPHRLARWWERKREADVSV